MILFVFNLTSKASFLKLREMWIGKFSHYCRAAKIVLIGMNLELRETGNLDHVSDPKAEQFVKEKKCAAYIPCSTIRRNQ